MRVRGWGLTDVGRKRQHNEDAFLCNDQLALYAVADGMGGHLGGERASRMAVEIVERYVQDVTSRWSAAEWEKAEPGRVHPALEVVREAIVEADRSIFDMGMADPTVAGMGTTLTVVLIRGERAFIGHVGDSRAYLYRNGKAQQLTEDHSWIQEQVRAGLLSPEEARESRFRNIITRSVGFEPSVEPDLREVRVEPGDCLLICSDGLSNYLSLEDIGQTLTSAFYRHAPQTFIEMANERGGDDNITCVAVYAANDEP